MDWITTTHGIITLVSSGIALIGSIIGLAITLYKKLKELAKDKNWLKIMEIADTAILEAEKLTISGAEKKNVALGAIEAGCKAAGIVCDLTAVGDYIDQCIDFANGIKAAVKKAKKTEK